MFGIAGQRGHLCDSIKLAMGLQRFEPLARAAFVIPATTVPPSRPKPHPLLWPPSVGDPHYQLKVKTA